MVLTAAGKFCLIDMHIPPGGGPPPHRHDFEETFIVLEGELDATFRGKAVAVRAGEIVNIPANAPTQFRNSSTKAVRMMCICSPAGQEEFFLEVGVRVSTRTTAPPKLDAMAQSAFVAKVQADHRGLDREGKTHPDRGGPIMAADGRCARSRLGNRG